MKKLDTRAVVTLGILVGIEIVLARFCSIQAWNIRIGFSFVPIAAAAMLYGPLGGGIVGALADFLGAILVPTGPYFPGFTLTAFLTGAVFGLFLYKKRTTPRVLGAVAVNQLVLSLLLQSVWISILYHSPYLPLLATRIVQCAVMIPTQFVVVGILAKALNRYWKRAAA